MQAAFAADLDDSRSSADCPAILIGVGNFGNLVRRLGGRIRLVYASLDHGLDAIDV